MGLDQTKLELSVGGKEWVTGADRDVLFPATHREVGMAVTSRASFANEVIPQCPITRCQVDT